MLIQDTAGTYDAVATGSQKTTNDNNGRGRHESEGWYYECERRARNKGLFLADQWLNGDDMAHTRQNPNGSKKRKEENKRAHKSKQCAQRLTCFVGGRRGLECPEERYKKPFLDPLKNLVVITTPTGCPLLGLTSLT